MSDGRTAPQHDSDREKLLCEWWDRWEQMTPRDFYQPGPGVGPDGLWEGDPNVKAYRQWTATHIKEIVALPVRFTYETEERQIYLQPKPDCTFTPPNPTWKRWADFSDRMWRKLKYKDGAHRGYTLDEIPDDDDDRYLLDRVIPAQEMTVEYGAPKGGKSAWAQKLSVCVASDDLDFDGMPVEHGRVLFVTLDPGARRKQVKRRIMEICKRLCVMDVLNNKKIIIVDDVVFLDDPESVDHFLQRNPGKFSLVVIDPLYKAMSGGDPSIAGAMVAATEGMKTIIEATGAALLIVHHATKANGEMYGSVFLKAALDAQIYVERAKDTVTVTVEVVKNGEPPEMPFTYRLEKAYLEPTMPAAPKRARADLLAMVPLTDTPRIEVRKLIEPQLNGATKHARDTEWSRIVRTWTDAGAVIVTGGAIRRVPQ